MKDFKKTMDARKRAAMLELKTARKHIDPLPETVPLAAIPVHRFTAEDYTPEEQAFLRVVDAWRRKHGRTMSVIEQLRLAVALGYCRMPFSATSEAGSAPQTSEASATGENAAQGHPDASNEAFSYSI